MKAYEETMKREERVAQERKFCPRCGRENGPTAVFMYAVGKWRKFCSVACGEEMQAKGGGRK